jgi:hypothetical protein
MWFTKHNLTSEALEINSMKKENGLVPIEGVECTQVLEIYFGDFAIFRPMRESSFRPPPLFVCLGFVFSINFFSLWALSAP